MSKPFFFRAMGLSLNLLLLYHKPLCCAYPQIKPTNSLVAEQFIQSLIRKCGRHIISDGGTWYPEACRFLDVEHHTHSSIEKSFIDDDYFPR
ncbi:MAG: hypothetical protein WBL44_04660 [Nitrososphaeraceae archaeon]